LSMYTKCVTYLVRFGRHNGYTRI